MQRGCQVISNHKIYRSIVEAVRNGKLEEPFSKKDFRLACPGHGEETYYNAFLDKHRLGNPGGNSELFERVSPGQFKLLRPIKYGI